MILINDKRHPYARHFGADIEQREKPNRDRNSCDCRATPAPNLASRAFRSNPNDDVDTADFGTGGRHWQARHGQIFPGNVLQLAGYLAEKVVVVGSISIK